jgi:hypothetical protein
VGEVFGDEVAAAAMIDRLVHHADVIALKGDSYRLRTGTSAGSPQPRPTNHEPEDGQFRIPPSRNSHR